MAAKPEVRKRNHKAPKTLVAQAVGEEATEEATEEVPEVVEVVEAPATPEYRNWNVRLPGDLAERIWGTCAALEDTEDLPSAVAFTVRAFEEFLDRLDDEHNNGKPYHADASPFRAGGRTTYRR